MVTNRHLSLKLHYKVERKHANKPAQETIQNLPLPLYCRTLKKPTRIIVFIKSSSYWAKMKLFSADHASNEATRKARKNTNENFSRIIKKTTKVTPV